MVKQWLFFVVLRLASGCIIKTNNGDQIGCNLSTFGKYLSLKTTYLLKVETESGCNVVHDDKVHQHSFLSALLIARGGCSFYNKAQYAASMSVGLLLISDSDENMNNQLIPIIAELGIDVNQMMIVGISSESALKLKQLPQYDAFNASISIEVAPENLLNQYVDRMDALTSRGFTMLATATLDEMIVSFQNKFVADRYSVSITNININKLQYIALQFSEKGFETAALTLIEMSTMIDVKCQKCWKALAQGKMKKGVIMGALHAFAQLTPPQNMDEIFLEEIVQLGRIAALKFLLSTNLSSVIDAATQWRRACEYYRSVPMSDRNRHRKLQDGLVKSGGQGDSTLWLMFTLTDEASRLKILDEDPSQCLQVAYNDVNMVGCCEDKELALLMDIHLTLSLFLDETGLFKLSRRHMDLAVSIAQQSCQTLPSLLAGLQLRSAAMTPTVFSSEEQLKLHQKHRSEHLDEILHSFDRASYLEVSDPALRYTITPASMMIGYQSLPLTPKELTMDTTALRKLTKLTTLMDPTSVDTSLIPLTKRVNKAEKKNLKIIKVGFVSSYLRSHSVGRLVSGVVSGLNEKEHIECHAFVAAHFLKVDQVDGRFADEILNSLAISLGRDQLHLLPVSHQVGRFSETAVTMITDAKLDLLVFPELGMDAVTLLLAMRRMAPVQCVFWGHPISQGLASIDYFISSDLFEQDRTSIAMQSLLSRQEGYHEQLIRLDGLSAFFSKPTTSAFTDPLELGIPTDAHIYLIPQTLMKFHPSFDEVLLSVLRADLAAVLVITFNPTQIAYQWVLERRLSRKFHNMTDDGEVDGESCNHKGGEINLLHCSSRIIFIPALEHDKYLSLLSATAVVLDPFPFGGGVTTLEALAVGAPVVTLPSMQSVVQLAAGFYRRMDDVAPSSSIAFPIASNVTDYVAKAVQLARSAQAEQKDSYHRLVKDRILRSHHVLYQDQEVIEEWAVLIGRLSST